VFVAALSSYPDPRTCGCLLPYACRDNYVLSSDVFDKIETGLEAQSEVKSDEMCAKRFLFACCFAAQLPCKNSKQNLSAVMATHSFDMKMGENRQLVAGNASEGRLV
jgi:hypothetical protein